MDELKFYLVVEQTVTTTCIIVQAKNSTHAKILRHYPAERKFAGEVSLDSVVGVGIFDEEDAAKLAARKELYGKREYLDADEGIDFSDEYEDFRLAMERDGD